MSLVLTLLGILIMGLGLGISIALHEIGHLVPAKKFGVKVTQYMIGFGPTVFSAKRGETEYGIKAIPLGGYIRMIGMYPPPKEHPEQIREDSTGFLQQMSNEAKELEAQTYSREDQHRTFVALSVPKKLVVMLGGPVMNLLLSIALFAVLLSGIGTPVISNQIQSVSLCVIPASAPRDASCEGMPEAPAYAAGLLPGDRILEVNDIAVSDFTELSVEIRKYPGVEVSLLVEREGQRSEVLATPIANEVVARDSAGNVLQGEDGEYLTEQAGFLGVTGAQEFQAQPLTALPGQVWDAFTGTARVVWTLPARMVDIAQTAFSSEERDPNGPIGIVGVSRLAGEVVSADADLLNVKEKTAMLISLLASLNMALFVFNLIPLMPLDGGHVLGAIIEGIRRFIAKATGRPDSGPVDMSKLLPLTNLVVLAFLAMTILLVYVDIVKPISIFGP